MTHGVLDRVWPRGNVGRDGDSFYGNFGWASHASSGLRGVCGLGIETAACRRGELWASAKVTVGWCGTGGTMIHDVLDRVAYTLPDIVRMWLCVWVRPGTIAQSQDRIAALGGARGGGDAVGSCIIRIHTFAATSCVRDGAERNAPPDANV